MKIMLFEIFCYFWNKYEYELGFSILSIRFRDLLSLFVCKFEGELTVKINILFFEFGFGYDI